MKEMIISLSTGLLVGFVFALFRLPVPAPPALAGIVGIFGIFLGVKIFTWFSAYLPFVK